MAADYSKVFFSKFLGFSLHKPPVLIRPNYQQMVGPRGNGWPVSINTLVSVAWDGRQQTGFPQGRIIYLTTAQSIG